MGRFTAMLLAGLLAVGAARGDETQGPVHYLHIQTLAPDAGEAFVDAMRATATHSRADAANQMFDIGSSAPTLVVFESWGDQASYLDNQASPQFAAATALLPGAFARPERLYALQDVAGLPAPTRKAIDAPAASKNIVVRLSTRPAQRQRFIDAVRGVVEQSRLAPGCLVFNVYQQRDDANAFVIYERWADAAAHQQHLATPYTATFIARLNSLLQGPPEGWELQHIQ